jgi:hypothetical protein
MSETTTAFARFVLSHAADSVVPGGGPLVPFAMTRMPDGLGDLHRFAGDLEIGQEMARTYVRDAVGIAQGAVAWDGYVSGEGQRMDAVMVEAFGGGEAESLIIAQRYRRCGLLRRRWETYGEPVALGNGKPLF